MNSDWEVYCFCQFVSIFGKLKYQTCTSHQLYKLHTVLLSFISNRNVAMSREPLELEIKDLAFRRWGSDCILMLISLEVHNCFYTSGNFQLEELQTNKLEDYIETEASQSATIPGF